MAVPSARGSRGSDEEPPCDRVLTADEIHIFWNGLDRDDLLYDRKTRLALKFALASMLRSNEFLSAHRDELFDLEARMPASTCP